MPSARNAIDAEVADKALDRLEIDALGLDAMDRRYLTMIADLYGGGPVGVETLAAGLSEPRDTIEDVIEPYLIQLGLIARTARGRCLNGRGWTHLGLNPPAGQPGRPVRSGSWPEVIRNMQCCPRWRCSRRRARAAATGRPPRAVPNYAKAPNWLCLPGPIGHLLDPAADDRAQSQWLWLDRPEPGGQQPADRLLLRLSDRLARPRPQQRPHCRR